MQAQTDLIAKERHQGPWRTVAVCLALVCSVCGVASIVNRHSSGALRLGAAVMLAEPLTTQQGPACLAEQLSGMQLDEQPWNLTQRSCLELARLQVAPEPGFMNQFQPHSRPLPPPQPALSAYDWTGKLSQPPHGWPNPSVADCPSSVNLMRVKIYKGVLYASSPHNSTVPEHQFWRNYRDMVYEMLLAVLWLYKDVPDVEFGINALDSPLHCNWSIPFMQFAVFNLTSPLTGTTLDIDPLEYVCTVQGRAAAGCKGYTKGFTVPVPDAWNQLSLAPRQLHWYSHCLHNRYAHSTGTPPTVCHVPRLPKMFWRGSSTGRTLGWSAQQATARHQQFGSPETHFLAATLLNKRVSLALTASKHPWMDVGLTRFFPEEVEGYSNAPENMHIAKLMTQLTKTDRLDIEQWPMYKLILTLDGHGPAFRLPRLLMGGVPVVKVESIVREWFIEAAVPGVHYEAVRYDLSDAAERSRSLLQEAQQNSSKLERMAMNAVQLGVTRFNALAQMDSVAWSLARIKEACNWTVPPPNLRGPAASSSAHTGIVASGSSLVFSTQPTKPEWYVVKLSKSRTWHNSIVERFKAQIIESSAQNFE